MRKILFAALIAVFVISCTDKKAEEKALFDEVIGVHDKVMGADEQLMKNKMLLDSMVKYNSTADIKDSVYKHLGKINVADSVMENWMHKFEPDYSGKAHDEVMSYLTNQKKQILSIDSQMNKAVTESGKYLLKMKMK